MVLVSETVFDLEGGCQECRHEVSIQKQKCSGQSAKRADEGEEVEVWWGAMLRDFLHLPFTNP